MRASSSATWGLLSILAVVAACGGGDDGDVSSSQSSVTVSTLAYVVTECRGDSEALTMRQSLQIRQGEQPPITVVEHSAVVPGAGRYCDLVGRVRQGPLFAELGVFRRLGVTPDGSQVVFEVTDQPTLFTVYPLVFPANSLPADEKGIFVVAADGTGLRRLGPASTIGSFFHSFFTFSPNGRTIAYNDFGLDSDNRNAQQIVTLDLVSGDRRQVTKLPPAGTYGGAYLPFFNDDQTITFFRRTAIAHYPFGENSVVTVHTDGTGLTVASPIVALPGSEVLTSFRITGSELDAAVLVLPGTPFQEVFDIDRENNILQLTNFGRVDTYAATVSADAQRVLFTASADPLGTNPTNSCQMFSIDRTGGDLRQLTNFEEHPEGGKSIGCTFAAPPLGCGAFFNSRDAQTDAVLFYSSCDPFGTNPYGSQIFGIRSDGTGLWQLIDTKGYVRDASGAVTVELPYPVAWPGFKLSNQVL